jgi:hypothetical protein
MASFLLDHRHSEADCDAVFAAWHGFASPLRHERVPSTCLEGGHRLFWIVQAADATAALALLPRYVAERTRAVRVRDVVVP